MNSTQVKNVEVGPELFRAKRIMTTEDKYERLEMIGRGTYGEVHKVRDKCSGKFRVVKTICKEKCQKSENIVDEIEILKKIDHPNIARFYEFFDDEIYYYLVMEYCPGGDLLSKIVKQTSFGEVEASKIFSQLMSALEYCHKYKIAHRDIKPENLVLDGESLDCNAKVIDFGRSKILQANDKLLELAGSLLYIAPEILNREEYDEKCDIWSAGVM